MQISPIPGFAWTNPAAANQQASTDARSQSVNSGTNDPGKPAIGDVERSSETMDRDANGQYDGSAMQRDPSSDDENKKQNSPAEPHSLLELPAHEQQGELDLLG